MRATKFVDSYIDAWNHCDAKGVAEHLTPDGVYRDVPENIQRTQEELIGSLSRFFSEYKHRYELIGEALSNRGSIAFQYRTLVISEKGDHAPTAAPYNGAEFMTIRGDAALTITDYYEVPGIARPPALARATTRTPAKKYAKSGLDDEHMNHYMQRLTNVMKVEQHFLEPNLTLPKLAATVGCSVNHLSQVINSGFGVSFFDYVNQYRVAHAQDLLTTLDGKNGAVLNIAFSVGFNSNSAFYAAFKKHVGQTPAQYRSAQAKSRHP